MGARRPALVSCRSINTPWAGAFRLKNRGRSEPYGKCYPMLDNQLLTLEPQDLPIVAPPAPAHSRVEAAFRIMPVINRTA